MADLYLVDKKDDPYKIAKKLIAAKREEFWHLESAKICFVWVDPDMTKDGRIKLGVTSKAKPVLALLTEVDFVIKLSQPFWQDRLTQERREGLILHELRHCGVRKERKSGQPIFIDGQKVPVNTDGTYAVERIGLKLAYCTVPHDAEIFFADFGTGCPGIDEVQEAAQKCFEFAEAG